MIIAIDIESAKLNINLLRKLMLLTLTSTEIDELHKILLKQEVLNK